ncbi:MAG: sugar ABC transporter substrate-binding protein [Treponema sp.]|nr:sugar ABC transporter substrate-binding protein [Treponema sp.]
MRKIAVVLVCALSLVTVLACAKKKENVPAEKTELTFGYIAYNMSDIWNEYSARAFEYAAAQAPKKVNVVIVDAKNSPEESINVMESLIQQGVDGISVFPVTPESGATQVKMANAAGIPVTIENVMMDLADPGDFIGAIACRYEDIGYAAIKFIADVMPGARIFFNAGGQGLGVYEMYQIGVDQAMAEVGDTVSIVATLNGDWLTEAAYNNTMDLINGGTEFDYVFANNGMIAKGTSQALRERGLSIPIVSTGGSLDDYQFLVEGVEAANMTAPVCIQGVQTFKNLYDFVVDGKRPQEKRKALPIIPVSADKLDEFIAWDDYRAAYNFVYGR